MGFKIFYYYSISKRKIQARNAKLIKFYGKFKKRKKKGGYLIDFAL